MRDRGRGIVLFEGLLIALPSGVGVAVSVLGGNMSSLVGVAISASLLPPAVNCGMLIAAAIVSFDTEGISMAVISLALAVENILIIFFVALVVFWFKRVFVADSEFGAFWTAAVRSTPQNQEEKEQQIVEDHRTHLGELNFSRKDSRTSRSTKGTFEKISSSYRHFRSIEEMFKSQASLPWNPKSPKNC